MERFQLTIPQQNIWNLQKYYSNTAIANLCGATFYKEKRDSKFLQQAIRQFIQNQSGIRLRFCEGETPVQYVSDEIDENIPVKIFSSMEDFNHYAEEFASVPLELTGRFQYRFVVFHIADRSGILVLLSHLVADAWTFGLLAKQLDEAYRQLAGGSENAEKISLVKADYTNYIYSENDYQISDKYIADKKYWEEKYAVCPKESLMKLNSALAESVVSKRISRPLPIVLEQKINAFCRTNSVTPAVLFETALILYLHRINPENEVITVGVPVLNRSSAREKEIAGMFVSTMPLTVAVDGEMTGLELAKRISKEHMNIFRHQKYPYANILRFLREKHQFSGNLYSVMISYQNAKTQTQADTKWYFNGFSEVPLVLHIDNRDGKQSHTINVDYQINVFREEEIIYILKRLEYVLTQIVEDGDRFVRDVDIVPEQEWEKIVCEFNDTYVDYPRDKCVHELFQEQAERTPDKVALVFEDKKFTYRQLDEMSNSLAHFLREKGVKPNDIVPIIARRSWHVIVAMIGVMKAGGAYMPVSPDYPEDRIEYMISEVKADFVLTYDYSRKNFTQSHIDLLCVNYDENIGKIMNMNTSENGCYLIFTSGSTGKPKAVLISHANLGNFVMVNNKNSYQSNMVQECSCVLADTVFSFDISIFEIVLPLLNGLTVVLTSDVGGAGYLAKLIEKNKVDVLHTTPTKLLMLLHFIKFQKAIANLKLIMVGAEILTKETVQKVGQYTDAVLYNGYGPTEATIGCSFKKIERKTSEQEAIDAISSGDITIGKPIANTQIYILDTDSNPVPIGVPGELCIAGESVGKGYLNRPELTAERFVPNPFATQENRHGQTLYHTGDLARWRTDGEIEYLGRIDTQVKIRGLRIELGEIESVMGTMEGIGLVAVTDKRDEDNRQYLVGYYTSETEIDEGKLREHLSAKLPRYMVPNFFMHLDAIPMTPSGKIDRRSLPVPDLTVSETKYAMPVTRTEQRLAMIWQQLLHVSQVGKTDDFFELGGDSLLAISMLNEIELQFQVKISIREIMEHTLLEQIAQCIDKAEAFCKISAYGESQYKLLPQQKAIYAVYQKNPDSLSYNMPAKVILPENINRDRLQKSIVQVLEHHKLLKSYICLEKDEIYGRYAENIEMKFEEYREGEEAAFVKPFDLERAPLVHVGFTENALLFDTHHIVVDGDSVNIILRDMMELYQGRELKEAEVQYSDYARYFYELDMESGNSYFRKMLKCDFEPVLLPETKEPGNGGRSKLYDIPEDIFRKTREYADRKGLTDTMVFLGAYGILLSKYTSEKDILTSIILQNRTHADTKDMVGMFVNTLPLHLSVKGNMSEYMETVKEILLNLFQYQEIPFWNIADAVGMKDKSVINTSFVYQGDGEKTLILDGQELMPQFMDTHTAKFDLTMELTPLKCGCRIRMEYNLAKYDEQLMDELVEAYTRILTQLHKERIADISVLSEEEFHQVTEVFNDTYVDYPRDKCVHELFQEQAERTPDKVALVFEDKKFTYRQLDEMSNSLACLLSEKGVKGGDRIIVLLKRDMKIIVAQLAIFKLGAVFVPIDSRYPQERINYICGECDAKLIIKNKRNSLSFKNELNIEDWINDKRESEYPKVRLDDVCYIIFTSGSTGQPKGCALTNRGLANFCIRNNILTACNQLKRQICISVNTISFDYFIAESLLPLLNGYTVVLATEKESENRDLLKKLILENDVNIIQTTPTRYRMYFSNDEDFLYLKYFEVIVTSGEALSFELLKQFVDYSNAKIFNPLGPSECSVWAVGGELHLTPGKVTVQDITIGRPIANTQIYILDTDSNPVPIGVPGELCIAGEGVGKGYLNRPELTAERFVPNPFATKENRHGQTLYHTGDLARWRTDGEIEYLGRIDTQVKIRGLRIELGEIESVMGTMEGIGLAAVTDKRDGDNRQYLVGYYTSETEIDERKLREHLSAKLPRYMVPNFFMRLDAIPMTPSGKIDRRNLPVPIFTGGAEEYVAPHTEREKALCRLMEELLGAERIGILDDFFEMGGDSLRAMEFMAKAHGMGIDFPLQSIFDHPTVQSLCEFMEREDMPKVSYEASDFDKYQDLFKHNRIEEDFTLRKKHLGNVLLTGATGFLGTHVLDELMRNEEGKIYCLVRCQGKDNGFERVHEIFRYYFGNQYEDAFGKRIILIPGDIEREELSEDMPSDVQTVIHTAASVSHYGSYRYFHRVNVEGTSHVINYAASIGARLIHISTLSVSGNSMADDFTVYRSAEEKHFGETSLYIGQPLDNVYIHSKFEAEKAVYDAMLKGLDAKVIRVGNLTNRARDFKFQPNYTRNAFLTRLKAIMEFGLFPDYLMPLYSEFSPVDLTAEGIVKIAWYADRQSVFHLYSNRPIYFDRFLEAVRRLGIPMEVIEGTEFRDALEKTIQDAKTEYIFEALQNDMDEQGRLVYDSNIHIMNEFTVWFLKKAGFEWPETDFEYIRGYVEYFRKLGYLKI